MPFFEEEVVVEPIMPPVICILDAEREGSNESTKPLVISSLAAELT